MATPNSRGQDIRIGFRQGLCASLGVCALVFAMPVPTQSDLDGRPRYTTPELRRAINWYARTYRLDPALLSAVIKAESDFRPDAVSHKGAVGLMQLMPKTAAALRVDNPLDPIQNIRAGAAQLRHLLDRYHGDLALALAAYNAGVQRVKGGTVPRIRETRAYLRKVLRDKSCLHIAPTPPRGRTKDAGFDSQAPLSFLRSPRPDRLDPPRSTCTRLALSTGLTGRRLNPPIARDRSIASTAMIGLGQEAPGAEIPPGDRRIPDGTSPLFPLSHGAN